MIARTAVHRDAWSQMVASTLRLTDIELIDMIHPLIVRVMGESVTVHRRAHDETATRSLVVHALSARAIRGIRGAEQEEPF